MTENKNISTAAESPMNIAIRVDAIVRQNFGGRIRK